MLLTMAAVAAASGTVQVGASLSFAFAFLRFLSEGVVPPSGRS